MEAEKTAVGQRAYPEKGRRYPFASRFSTSCVFPSEKARNNAAKMKTMLTIAGFDPSSGAGVTADLLVCASFRCFGTACITALTVQSTRGVLRTEPVAAELVSATLACLEDDLLVDGVKIGMLATEENVLAVCRYLERLRARSTTVPIVLDPVLRSSSGRELLDAAGVELLREDLLPLVGWVTPNLAELAVLTDMQVETQADMETATLALAARYRTLSVVAKGGHLEGNPQDLVLESGKRMTWLAGERVVSRSTHGTGCALSTALACGLAQGAGGVAAATAAKEFVRVAIGRALPIGQGCGPMNLLWPLQK